MTLEHVLRELNQTLRRVSQTASDLSVTRSNEEGWVTVSRHGRQRHYPLTPEIGVLLSGDVRRGVFD